MLFSAPLTMLCNVCDLKKKAIESLLTLTFSKQKENKNP